MEACPDVPHSSLSIIWQDDPSRADRNGGYNGEISNLSKRDCAI